MRVPGSGAPDSDADERGGEGWAHPRDNEKGTGYRCGKDFMFSGPQGDEGDLTKKALPLLAYVHAAKECDVVFCGVCGCSLWLDTRAEFAERDGDIISMNVSIRILSSFRDSFWPTPVCRAKGRQLNFVPYDSQVRLFKDIDTTKIVTRPGRGKSFPPEYVPQYEP